MSSSVMAQCRRELARIRVIALSFTGSFAVGQQIYKQLAERMARAQMEMGERIPPSCWVTRIWNWRQLW
jgi:hypothetical protein